MIWFSSDFHFGHTNIAGPKISRWNKGYRTFESVHEMNKALTTTINKYVAPDDILYFLGDFAFGGHMNIPAYRHSLLCQTIHVCLGNHDHHLLQYKELFSSVQDTLLHPLDNGVLVYCSHYAHRVWPKAHRGAIHLYGHSHGSLPLLGGSMDVGVDVAYAKYGEYRPFSLPEVLNNIQDFRPVDHHI